MAEKKKYDHCLNCGEPLNISDDYCSHCGQENADSRIHFKELVKDFLGDFFTFDSKLFRSLHPLLLQPGKLTKDYLDGKRVRFIPPIRIFVFLSIIFFFVLSLDPVFNEIESGDIVKVGSKEQLKAEVRSDSLKNILANPQKVSERIELDRFQELNKKYTPEQVADSLVSDDDPITKLFIKQAAKINQSGPNAFVQFLIGNGSVMLLILVPLFAVLLKLLYIRRNEYFTSHFIFSLHFHAFVLILLLILQIFHIITDYYFAWLLLILPVYLFYAIKKVYPQTMGKVFLKELLLIFSYGIIVMPVVFFTSLLVSFLVY